MKGYVKFTGQYNKLKSMGFEFQKLHAMNYMQWERNDFRIWKKGSEITHDELRLYTFMKFLETCPTLRVLDNRVVSFYYIRNDKTHEVEYLPYTEENKKMYWAFMQNDDDFPDIYISSQAIDKKTLDDIKEFKDLGWYELVDLGE